MSITRLQKAKATAIMTDIVNKYPGIMDPDPEEDESPYRCNANQKAIVTRIKIKPTSIWKIAWFYFKALITENYKSLFHAKNK